MTSPKDDLEELKPDVGDGGALTSPDEERAEDVSVVALVDESAMQTRRTQEGAGAAAVDVVRDRAVRPGTVAVVDEPGESDEPGEVEGPDQAAEPVEGAVAVESAELEPDEAERMGDEPSATPDKPGGERAQAGEPDPDAEGPTESAAVVGEGESGELGEPDEAEGPDPAEQPVEGAVAAESASSTESDSAEPKAREAGAADSAENADSAYRAGSEAPDESGAPGSELPESGEPTAVEAEPDELDEPAAEADDGVGSVGSAGSDDRASGVGSDTGGDGDDSETGDMAGESVRAGAPDSESDDRADAHAHEAAAGGVEDADDSEGTADADDTADAEYIEDAESTENTEPTAAEPYDERASAANDADDADEAAEAVPEAVEAAADTADVEPSGAESAELADLAEPAGPAEAAPRTEAPARAPEVEDLSADAVAIEPGVLLEADDEGSQGDAEAGADTAEADAAGESDEAVESEAAEKPGTSKSSERSEKAIDLPPSYPPARRPRPLPVPGEEEDDSEEDRPRRGWLSTLAVVVVVLALSAFIKTHIVQTFAIPSGSMENTLQTEDHVSVRMYHPHDVHRGDVVVFTDPGGWLDTEEPSGINGIVRDGLILTGLLPENSGHHLIKRVIGVSGDRITSDGAGALTVNGVPLQETYIKDGAAPSLVPFDIIVPEGCIWVMGDNRSNSSDSRFHQDDPHGGAVPLDDVVGVATNVVWPVSRWDSLDEGEAVFRDVPDPNR